jgi:LCP family protein required for cell wall assembly
MSKYCLRLILITEVILGGMALVYIFSAFWHRPLGPILEQGSQEPGSPNLSSNLPELDEQDTLSQTVSVSPASGLLDQISTIFSRPNKSLMPLCGGPSELTLLVVGSDARENGYLYGLADSIRIVRIDFTVPKVMLLDIPRDLWVDIPGIEDHYGITQGKLNQAYFFGNPGMGYYDGPGEGPGLLARTLELNYGIQVDHYLAMDRKTFVDIINAIGGIDVQINSMIDMNEGQNGANPQWVMQVGNHHLDGDMALKLSMNRFPSIFQRARNQNIVLQSLQEKLLHPSMLADFPKLVTQFVGSVQTDLSPSDFNQLICIAQKSAANNTEIVAFPEEMFVPGSTYDPYRQVNTYTLAVDNSRIREYMADFMQGTWPDNPD